ncbi:MAG: L-aspartate oxidase [Clostridia bacterium]
MREQINYDVIVVGTGVAGLFAALNLPENLKVLMITKSELEKSDSSLAQGGICVLRSQADFDCYFEDTMRAGHYENDPESVRIMIDSSQKIIEDLIDLGVDFDICRSGYDYTREGAHTIKRILHHKDVTGKEITEKLIARARERDNITIMEYTVMTDIVIEDGVCHGILAERDGEISVYGAKAVILATGGLGGLFRHSTNFRHITGDSFAIALKKGIELENIHYIQIHPTTLYSEKEGRRFLISESVRGEGAILLNPDGERFVDELLPRDVVTEAIRKEMEKFGCNCMYITLPDMTAEEAEKRFPNIYKACLDEGYCLAGGLVPITPSQHYLMGGIKTDHEGRTGVRNLYAAGETACNGVHGRNRLASNSLLESLVFSQRAARAITLTAEDIDIPEIRVENAAPYSKSENKRLVLEEIKRKDREFYDKWCNDEN